MTDNELKVLEYIREYKKTNGGNSPSVREIGEATGIRYTSIPSILRSLSQQGYIIYDGKKSRFIILKERQ
ncbi:MAG: hypothetical protein QXS54_11250 [Candidatus Methanomethylicaceae archaeon]